MCGVFGLGCGRLRYASVDEGADADAGLDAGIDAGAMLACTDGVLDMAGGCYAALSAGSFTMGAPLSEVSRFGDDETQHVVSFTRMFLFQATEITQGQFESITGFNPSRHSLTGSGTDCGTSCPVENVSFYDLLAYANALSRAEGLAPCYALTNVSCVDATSVGADDQGCMTQMRGGIQSATVALAGVASVYDCEGYRLPTDSEWEYGARAGDPRATYNGELDAGILLACDVANPTLDPIAWFCGNSGNESHPVSMLSPNEWGIYDTSGNVWEWTWDWYIVDNTTPEVDPEGPATGSGRCLRGGCFGNTEGHLRAANRWSQPASFRSSQIGGRLARTLPN